MSSGLRRWRVRRWLGGHGANARQPVDHRGYVEVIDLGQAHPPKLRVQLLWNEVAEERLARRGDPGCTLLVRGPQSRVDAVARLAVIEDDLRPAWMSSDLPERQVDRLQREIGNHAQPREERSNVRLQSSLREPFGQILPFEVQGEVHDAVVDGDIRFIQTAPLPRLGGGMVDLEHPQSGAERVAVGEGVEPCAEHDQLPDPAVVNAGGKCALGDLRASDHEEAHAPVGFLDLGMLQKGFRIDAENLHGQGVRENAPMFQHLVRRAVRRRRERRPTGFPLQHAAPKTQ